MSQAPAAQADWVRVGAASSFGARTTIKVHGRKVTVLRLRKRGTRELRWTCLDAVCYHAGGPLYDGQVVAVDGRTCLKCPWHSYLIDVFTGEGLYLNMSREYKSKGLRQRLHEVEVRDDANVYVRLQSAFPAKLPSDDYAFDSQLDTATGSNARRDFPEFPTTTDSTQSPQG